MFGMRGLSNFVEDIRSASSKEDEQQRVVKELANIRSKIKTENLSSYQKKKYMWKLLYILLLGYDVDFGIMEAVALLSSTKFSEKHVGYLACSLLLHEDHDMLKLIVNSTRSDIADNKNEAIVSLALSAVANIGGAELAEYIAQDIQKLLVGNGTAPFVRKKAALALLRIVRSNSDVVTIDEWVPRLEELLRLRDQGVRLSVLSLVVHLASRDPARMVSMTGTLVGMLKSLALTGEKRTDSLYHGVPNPWMQVKILRCLLHLPVPGGADYQGVIDSLRRTLEAAKLTKSVNHNNAVLAVVLEALAVALHYDNKRVLEQFVQALSSLLPKKEPNLRYVALEGLARCAATPELLPRVRAHKSALLAALRDADVSIRRRALDVIFAICDQGSATEVISELVEYLTIAEENIMEELVVRIAVLCERYIAHSAFFVQVVLRMIRSAGAYVSTEVWHRVLQLITNNQPLQEDFVERTYRAMQDPKCHEVMVKVGAYAVGEFGQQIANKQASSRSHQVALLKKKLPLVGEDTQGIILTALAKIAAQSPEAATDVQDSLASFTSNINCDLQQRAIEFSAVNAAVARGSVSKSVWDPMPAYANSDSGLSKRLREREQSAADATPERSRRASQESPSDSNESPTVAVPTGRPRAASALSASPSTTAAEARPSANALLDDLLGDAMSTASTGNPVETGTPHAPSGGSGSGSGDSLLDLLGDIGPSTAQAYPAPTPLSAHVDAVNPVEAQHPSVTDDLLASLQLGHSSAPAQSHTNEGTALAREGQGSPSPSGALGLAVEDLAGLYAASENEDRALGLADRSSGVLYETENVQIGFKGEFRGTDARFALFVGNRSQSPLEDVRIAPAPNKHAVLLRAAAAPSSVQPGAQSQHAFQARCTGPFRRPPQVQVSFSTMGACVSVSLDIPLFVTKFIAGETANAQQFFGFWKAIPAGAPTEVMQVCDARHGVSQERMQHALQHAGVAVLHGIDPNPANAVGLGRLGGTLVIAIRIESNAARKQYRTTVRCPNGDVAAEVHRILSSML